MLEQGWFACNICGIHRSITQLSPPVLPFSPLFGEGSPTKIDYRKKGTLNLISLLENLVKHAQALLGFSEKDLDVLRLGDEQEPPDPLTPIDGAWVSIRQVERYGGLYMFDSEPNK